jgi:hypothetical protein
VKCSSDPSKVSFSCCLIRGEPHFTPYLELWWALKISSDMLKQALIFFGPMMALVGAQIAPLDCGLPLPASPQWSGTSRSIDEVRGLIPPISTQLTE